MSESGSDGLGAAAPAGMREQIAGRLGIAVEGVVYTVGAALAGVVAIIFGAPSLGILILIASAAIGMFFRDPERRSSAPDDAILSAADGRVTEIGESPLPDLPERELYRRVSVFMSPLDVHVNRAPVAGEIATVRHTAGEFRAAYSDTASEHNERNLIVIADPAGRRHAMVQVAGYLARRIVCRVRPGARVARGERVGVIMFGSRVDHYLPLEYRIAVRTGDRVRAGESVIGEAQR